MAKLTFALITILVFVRAAIATTSDAFKLEEDCESDGDCVSGESCLSCSFDFKGHRCVRSSITNQFELLNNSLPFNKYAFLTTHNSFSIRGEPSRNGVPRITFSNQEDSVTEQLNNGVRALMLDTYDFEGDVWLCHSFNGECHDYTAFEPAIYTFGEIEAFLSRNPSEIVTLILEDYVQAPNGLTKVFNDSGLKKYWFPLSKMPENGQDWPLVNHMIANNQRLIVFSSIKSKQESEGIAYQWNYMVENQYGNDGLLGNKCTNRRESSSLDDKTRSLVLVNHFASVPVIGLACIQNSASLLDALHKCYAEAGNRWSNFVAVDFYKRSEGGGAFQATDFLNGNLLCGCNDVTACLPGSSKKCAQVSNTGSRQDRFGMSRRITRFEEGEFH
ncbi:hypothetical protein K2173_016996 [Erythroxylum novogranatense]|uniref:Uncharacterized protein n=1 Tax=Erythroxylum novogranatense TaxID=1862640 RepID=A0AAV8U5J4_9ROSI|nr:hypothetical protein K2173_016996 [Erythroxylum novogranatense]